MAEFISSTENLVLPSYNEQMRWGYYLINAGLGNQQFSLKYENTRGNGIIPQGIIVDTTGYTGGNIDILWDIGDINFPITIAANTKVSLPVPAKPDVVFSVNPAAGSTGTIRLDLTNFPLLPVNITNLTNITGSTVTVVNTSSQPVPVTDQTLSGLVSSLGTQTTSGVTTNTAIITSGSVVSSGNPFPVKTTSGSTTAVTNTSGSPLYTSDTVSSATLLSGSATASGSTSIGTPPANSNMRKIVLSINDNATQAVAGTETVTVTLNGNTVFSEGVYVPSTALSNSGELYQRQITFDNIAFNAGATGTLTVSLANALTAGALYVNAYFD